MSRKVLGIDIRRESVSAVMVKTSLRENRIDAHAFVPIPDSEDRENSIRAALGALTREIDIVGCDCVVSIAADHFSFRNLKIPFKNPKKIRMVLPFELEPTIPTPVDDLVIDFIDLESADPGDHTDLIAAAVPQSRLTPYLASLAEIKLDPEVVTVSGLPAALCLAKQADAGEDRMLLTVDTYCSILFVIEGGQIRLIRSFPTPAAVESRTQSLCAFIRRTLAAFGELSRLQFQPLDMVVTGSGLNGLNVENDMAGILKLPVKQLNFAERLMIANDSGAVKPWNSALMDNALALALTEIEALRGLNFHKGQFAAKKFLLKHKKYLTKTGILAAAVLALLFFNVIIESYTLNKQQSRLDRQITAIFQETFPEVTKIVDPYREMQIKVQEAKKNEVFQIVAKPHVRTIDILNNISQKIPDSIVVDITRMVVSPENVLISGNTDTFNSVDDIKSRLEQIDFFQKVTISSANVDRSGKEVRFQLKAEF